MSSWFLLDFLLEDLEDFLFLDDFSWFLLPLEPLELTEFLLLALLEPTLWELEFLFLPSIRLDWRIFQSESPHQPDWQKLSCWLFFLLGVFLELVGCGLLPQIDLPFVVALGVYYYKVYQSMTIFECHYNIYGRLVQLVLSHESLERQYELFSGEVHHLASECLCLDGKMCWAHSLPTPEPKKSRCTLTWQDTMW